MKVQAEATGSPPPRDYDMHGILSVRVLPYQPGDGANVKRVLGSMQTKLTRQPDITIRFVQSIATPSTLRHIGFNAGFTDDSFFLFRPGQMDAPRLQIAFEEIGEPMEIVCQSGETVPLLLPLINLVSLSKGVLPLHAAAFLYDGAGVLVTGWAKGGKTETLLAFAAHGAQFIGDEWIYISNDGKQICGLPLPVRVWDWHLAELPYYKRQVTVTTRARWRAIRAALSMINPITTRHSNGRMTRFLSTVEAILQDKLSTFLTPRQLTQNGSPALQGSLDKLFFVTSHKAPEITVKPIEPHKAAERMAFSLDYERLPLLSSYLAFRFAFPAQGNKWIDDAHAIEREMLTRMFQSKEAFEVQHPYPFSLPALFERCSPYVTK